MVILGLCSCSVTDSTTHRHSVEAEDLLYITTKTRMLMDDCFNNVPYSCTQAQKLFDDHPWLFDLNVEITNNKGMRQDEWDTHATAVMHNIQYIKQRYTAFTSETSGLEESE